MAEWTYHRDQIIAAEIVGCAVASGLEAHPEVQQVAEFLLHHTEASKINILTSKRILGLENHDEINIFDCDSLDYYRKQIKALRRRLSDFARDPTRWADLGFYYAAVGEREKAGRCMVSAYELGRENRFIARSVARYFLHMHDSDSALSVLRKSIKLNEDPWLISAEIATSEVSGRKSRLIDKGMGFLKHAELDPIHISELAGAIGTIDFAHGSKRRGREKIQRALIDPTENAVAQAQWLSDELGESIGISPPHVELQFEADANRLLNERRYRDSFEACKRWLCMQPFSSRPAVFGAYVASVALEDYESAISIIERARIASPDSVMLRNNLAFALALTGRLDRAKAEIHVLEGLDIPAYESAVLKATLGLIEFRSGNYAQGRELYRDAMTLFQRNGNSRSEILARLFWAREEIRTTGSAAQPEFEFSEAQVKGIRDPEVIDLLDRLKMFGLGKAR